MMEDDTKPWLEKRFNRWEINLPYDNKHVIINVGVDQVVEIDKLYGPLAALGVRIRLEYTDKVSDWVVEREVLQQDQDGNCLDAKWIEMARWYCQLDWPKD